MWYQLQVCSSFQASSLIEATTTSPTASQDEEGATHTPSPGPTPLPFLLANKTLNTEL